MSSFLPAIRISQSGDGKVITVTDISPYGAGNNDENYVIGSFVTRQVDVRDAFDNLLQTIVFGAGLTIATFTITGDLYLKFAEGWVTATPLTYQSFWNYMSTQFFKINQDNYGELIICGCKCTSKQQERANAAEQCIDSAIFQYDIGQGVAAQKRLDAGNKLIIDALSLT